MLEALGFDAFKIASGDLTYDGLIARARRAPARRWSSRPAWRTLDEVRARASTVARTAGAGGVGVLHCVSAYPTPVHDENLRAIRHAGAPRAACRSACRITGAAWRRRWPRWRSAPTSTSGISCSATTRRRSIAPVSSTPEEFAAIVDGDARRRAPRSATASRRAARRSSRTGCRAAAACTPRGRSPRGTSCAPATSSPCGRRRRWRRSWSRDLRGPDAAARPWRTARPSTKPT